MLEVGRRHVVLENDLVTPLLQEAVHFRLEVCMLLLDRFLPKLDLGCFVELALFLLRRRLLTIGHSVRRGLGLCCECGLGLNGGQM